MLASPWLGIRRRAACWTGRRKMQAWNACGRFKVACGCWKGMNGDCSKPKLSAPKKDSQPRCAAGHCVRRAQHSMRNGRQFQWGTARCCFKFATSANGWCTSRSSATANNASDPWPVTPWRALRFWRATKSSMLTSNLPFYLVGKNYPLARIFCPW